MFSKDSGTMENLQADYLIAWQLQIEEYKKHHHKNYSTIPIILSSNIYQFKDFQGQSTSFILKTTKGDGDCFFHAVNKPEFNRKALVKQLLDNATEEVRAVFACEIRQFLYLGYTGFRHNEQENKACQQLLAKDIRELFLILEEAEKDLTLKVNEVRTCSKLSEVETHGKRPGELLILLQQKDPELAIEFKATYQTVINADKNILDYCSQELIFKNYVTFYLDEAQGYIPFSRDFGGNRVDTTIDIINRLFNLNIQVFMVEVKNKPNLMQINKAGQGEAIPIFHNGVNHFSGLTITSPRNTNSTGVKIDSTLMWQEFTNQEIVPSIQNDVNQTDKKTIVLADSFEKTTNPLVFQTEPVNIQDTYDLTLKDTQKKTNQTNFIEQVKNKTVALLNKSEILKKYQTAQDYAKEQDLDLKKLINESLKKKLEIAYYNKNYQDQYDLMTQLAKFQLENQNYSDAAKLFNGALMVIREQSKTLEKAQMIEDFLIKELKEVEAQYVREKLNTQYNPSPDAYGINLNYKQRLKKIRKSVKEQLDKYPDFTILPDHLTLSKVQALFKWITHEINILLREIFDDCISLMPSTPPCDYALIGIGSLAREEMTPYSDLECFLLISKSDIEYKQYFEHVCQLFAIKIINLGETDLVKGEALLPVGMPSPVRKGFSLDVHKNPRGIEQELIGTPEELVKFQLPAFYINEEGNHLSNSLLNVIFITGNNNNLLEDYRKKMSEIYKEVDASSQQSLRLMRSLAILKTDIDHFRPKMGSEDRGRLFQIKDDLYRLPQTIIDALSLNENLCEASTWDRIDGLCQKEMISAPAAQRLKQVLSVAVWFRLKTYIDSEYQPESLSIIYEKNNFRKRYVPILMQVLETMVFLHKRADQFYKSQGKDKHLLIDKLEDDTLYTKGIVAIRLCQYDDAIKILTGILEGLEHDASSGADNTIKKQKKDCFDHLAMAWQGLGNFRQAIECFEKVLSIDEETYGKDSSELAATINNMGAMSVELGELRKAVVYFERAIQFSNIKITFDIGNTYIQLGEAWRMLGERNKAVKYIREGLYIEERVYDRFHPIVASCYENLGSALQDLHEFNEALECYKHALTIVTMIYGTCHPVVARAMNNIGTLWKDLEEYDKAIEWHQRALSIRELTLGKNHPEVAYSLNNLASAWGGLNQNYKAIELYMKALSIDEENFGRMHTNVALRLTGIGVAWRRLKEFKKAIACHEEALAIYKQKLGENSPDVARTLYNLSVVWINLEDFDQAVFLLDKAIVIADANFPPEHPFLISCLGELIPILSKGAKQLSIERIIYLIERMIKAEENISSINPIETAKGYIMLSGFYKSSKQPAKRLTVLQKAKPILECNLDTTIDIFLDCLNSIGETYRDLSKYPESIEYFKKVISLSSSNIEAKKPETVIYLVNMGNTLLHLNVIEEAITHFEIALVVEKANPGRQDSMLNAILSNLGLAHKRLGNLEMAKNYYEQSIIIAEQTYGSEHPNIGIQLHNMGLLLMGMKDFRGALQLFQKVINIFLFCPNEDLRFHPDKLGTHEAVKKCREILKLAPEQLYPVSTLKETNKNTENIVRKIETKENKNKENESKSQAYIEKIPQTQSAMGVTNGVNSLGLGDTSQVKASNQSITSNASIATSDPSDDLEEETSKDDQKSLIEAISKHGEKSSEVAIILNNIATQYMNQGNFQKALDCLQKALSIEKNISGERSENVVIFLNHLGQIYRRLGRYNDAIDCYEQCLDISKSTCGENSSEVASYHNNLGLAYKYLEKYEEALKHYQESLPVLEQIYGKSSAKVAIVTHNMANIYSIKKNYEKALLLFRESLAIHEASKDAQPSVIAASHIGIGNIYQAQRQYEKALECYKKSLELRKAYFKSDHPDIAETYHNLGTLYFAMHHYSDGQAYFQKSLDMQERYFGKNHPQIAFTLRAIGENYHSRARLEDALNYYQQALEVQNALQKDAIPMLTREINTMTEIIKREIQDQKTASESASMQTAYDLARKKTGKISTVLSAEREKNEFLIRRNAATLEHVLWQAAADGEMNDLEMALQFGADINAQTSGSKKTALHWAIINGKTTMITTLLANNARIDIKDCKDKTAEDYAKEKEISLVDGLQSSKHSF